MSAPLLLAQWTGEAFAVMPRFAKLADEQFVVGEIYAVHAQEQRSAKSHAHLFAVVKDAWANLRPPLSERFRSPEALRKWCLIRAGYYRERTITLPTTENAQAVAAFAQGLDEFAVIDVVANVVTIYTAQSQSVQAMGPDEFRRSKTAVFSILDEMLGTDRGIVERHAARAA